MSHEGGRAPAWARRVLVGILLLDVWWRGHTLGPTVRQWTGLRLWPVVEGQAEPLDCDEAVYAFIGRRIADGAVMYRDLTENKPPLGYWLYALAVTVGGATEATIRLMPLPMVLGTIALVWWIGLRLRGPATACLAALLYAMLSTDPYLFGNGANMEHMINLFATASLALMVRWQGGARRWTLTAAGACVGAAALVKPLAALHGLVYAGAVVRNRRDGGFRSVLTGLVRLAVGFATPCLAAAAILAAQGALRAAYDDAVRYAGASATDLPPDPNQPPFLVRLVTGNADPAGRLPWPFGRTDYLVWWGAGSWPLWLAGTVGLAWLLRGRSDAAASRRLVAAWTISAWVQVALPGLFWPHYYLLPTPGVALAAAVLLGDGFEALIRPGRVARRLIALATATAVLAAAIGAGAIQVRDYLLVAPEPLTVRYKGGGQWVVNRELGRELGRRAAAAWDEPHLFVWGIQSPLYFYSGLDNVTPQVFTDNLVRDHAATDHSVIRPRIERTMRDLHERRPELIFAGYPPFPELRAFLAERYAPTGLSIAGRPLGMTNGMGLWVRLDGYARFERGP